ncbi:MAG TPA: hypothetical protein VL856_17785 [Acidimicrobiia bacterium]|jgi:hypothetical protein|nr:hypothetical protein [Acidimicrobiia bacterium]
MGRSLPAWTRAGIAVGVLAVGAFGLAGCKFDQGMNMICVRTSGVQGSANFFADTRDCPGENLSQPFHGNAWLLGAASPKSGGGFCNGDTDPPYKINGNVLSFGATRSLGGLRYTMGIVGNPCESNAEISYGLFHPDQQQMSTARTHMHIQVLNRSGTYHVHILAYMRDNAGNKKTVNVTLRPTADDTRWNHPAAGILGHVHPVNRKGEVGDLVIVDGDALGLPHLCTQSACNETMIEINWSQVLSFIQSKGIWTNFDFNRTGSIEFELQTFDLNSRVRASVGGWYNF